MTNSIQSESPKMPRSRTSQTQKKDSEKIKVPATSLLKNGSDPESLKSSVVPKERDRQKEVLRRLKVTEEDLAKSPEITSFIKQLKGGKESALQAMRFSSEPNVVAFLNKHDSISAYDLERIPWEAIAISAQINIASLLGEVMLAIREYSARTVMTLAIDNHPDVMRKRIEFAQLPGGTKDRDALDTMLGALPQKQAPIFINRFFGGSLAESIKNQEPSPGKVGDDVDYIFPDCELMQEKLTPIRQKLLEK